MPSSSHELPISRRFFKVMVPGFHSKFVRFPINGVFASINFTFFFPNLCSIHLLLQTIPPAFCQKLKGDKSEKGTIIKGKDTWNVEIGRSKKGKISFDKGWEKFVQNYNLRVGDFAVFEYLGNMNFTVTLLDSTGSDKKLLENGQQLPSQEKKVKSTQCGIGKFPKIVIFPVLVCIKLRKKT